MARPILAASDSFFANKAEPDAEQNRMLAVKASMKRPRSLIPRLSEAQSEALRAKLSDYVAALLEKNAARLAKYEKPQPRVRLEQPRVRLEEPCERLDA